MQEHSYGGDGNIDHGKCHTFVNSLFILGVPRVCARIFVVEFAQASGVEVRSNAEHPRSWDGV